VIEQLTRRGWATPAAIKQFLRRDQAIPAPRSSNSCAAIKQFLRRDQASCAASAAMIAALKVHDRGAGGA